MTVILFKVLNVEQVCFDRFDYEYGEDLQEETKWNHFSCSECHLTVVFFKK